MCVCVCVCVCVCDCSPCAIIQCYPSSHCKRLLMLLFCVGLWPFLNSSIWWQASGFEWECVCEGLLSPSLLSLTTEEHYKLSFHTANKRQSLHLAHTKPLSLTHTLTKPTRVLLHTWKLHSCLCPAWSEYKSFVWGFFILNDVDDKHWIWQIQRCIIIIIIIIINNNNNNNLYY